MKPKPQTSLLYNSLKQLKEKKTSNAIIVVQHGDIRRRFIIVEESSEHLLLLNEIGTLHHIIKRYNPKWSEKRKRKEQGLLSQARSTAPRRDQSMPSDMKKRSAQ